MQKTYRSREGFIRRNIANCEVIIPIGGNVADFNGFIELNSSAAFIWNKLTDGISKEELLREMCEFFEILLENKMIEEVK